MGNLLCKNWQMRKYSKSQSAIEFLTTYGWALIIIVIVLAALYNVGLFSGNAFISTQCTAQVGFFCSTPVLNSTGVVTVQFGETVGQITVVGIGCSNSSTQSPVIQPLPTSQQMQQGSRINLDFQCKIKSPSLGTTFAGALWVNYTNQYGQKIETPFAKFSAKVSSVQSIGGGSVNPSVQIYVPITITNSQSSNTPSPFQEYVTFNPSSYSQYEANDLGNIRFYQGPIGTNELYSWCEIGCSNSSTSSVFWIRLPSGIAASTAITVNMSFGTTATRTTEYDDNFAGEASNFTTTFGKYDNGANVFLYYNNGQTLPSINSGSYGGASLSSQTNPQGITSNTIDISVNQFYPVWVTTPISSGDNVIMEGWVGPSSGAADIGYSLRGSSATAAYGYTGQRWNGPAIWIMLYNGITNTGLTDSGSDLANAWGWDQFSVSGNTLTDILYTGAPPEMGGSLYSSASTTNTELGSASTYIGYAAWSGTNYWYTTRARAYPPGGTMPGYSVGALV
jgi:hypothetical protein